MKPQQWLKTPYCIEGLNWRVAQKARRPFYVFYDLLARAFAYSSRLFYVPLLSSNDEPTTISY